MEEILPDVRKVDKKHLFKTAEAMGIKPTDVRGTAKLMGETFVDLPANKLADCDNCGGQSDAKLDCCPYCGVADDENVSTDDSMIPEPPPGTAGSTLAATRTEKELDAAVDGITKLKAEGGKNLWLLGKAIATVYDTQLWKQRTDDKDKPAYKSFDDFARKELLMTKTTAYWMMDVSKSFDQKLAGEYGTTKLGHILQAPKEDRQLLLDKMKAGASAREIAEEVRERKKKAAANGAARELPRQKDSNGRDIKKRAAASSKAIANKAPKKKARTDAITIAKMLGKQQVKLFKKPEKKGEEPTTRARKLGDRPFGKLVLENGVVQTFTVTTSSSGELFLSVDTTREK